MANSIETTFSRYTIGQLYEICYQYLDILREKKGKFNLSSRSYWYLLPKKRQLLSFLALQRLPSELRCAMTKKKETKKKPRNAMPTLHGAKVRDATQENQSKRSGKKRKTERREKRKENNPHHHHHQRPPHVPSTPARALSCRSGPDGSAPGHTRHTTSRPDRSHGRSRAGYWAPQRRHRGPLGTSRHPASMCPLGPSCR